MNALDNWALRWGIRADAMADLRKSMITLDQHHGDDAPPLSEGAVLADARMRAPRLGMRLWRNNVGAGKLDNGSFLRWGLANDSPAVNAVVKSGDLIGIRSRIIQPADVGQVFGQFVSYECKHGGWRWSGDDREVAQLAWATLVQSFGGDARFITSGTQL